MTRASRRQQLSRHKFIAEEGLVMGEFINRGIAIGFTTGVAAALLARRYALTRKHPNLIGFAVAGTCDAVSRDYRRPAVYERLMKLDSPLGSVSRTMLSEIRRGVAVSDQSFMNPHPSRWNPPGVSSNETLEQVAKSEDVVTSTWWDSPSTEADGAEETGSVMAASQSLNPHGSGKPAVGYFTGTRTWDEIRQDSSSVSDQFQNAGVIEGQPHR